jgi:hypothetical protein
MDGVYAGMQQLEEPHQHFDARSFIDSFLIPLCQART